MSSKCYLSASIVTILAFALLDGLYIGVLGRKHWSQQIQLMNNGNIAKPNAVQSNNSFRLYAAAIAYVLMLVAMLIFVVKISENWKWALLWGAILGLCIYGIFNFTNLAIFKHYQCSSAMIDTSWGIFLFAVTGALATYTSMNWKIIK